MLWFIFFPSNFPMNASGSSPSLPVQDPRGNQSWEGSSCPGEASQECQGFTIAPGPRQCLTEGHVQWQAADSFAGGRLLCLPAGGCCRVPGPGEDSREAGEEGSCPDEGGFSAELHPAHGGRDGAVHGGEWKSFLPPVSPADVVSYSSLLHGELSLLFF